MTSRALGVSGISFALARLVLCFFARPPIDCDSGEGSALKSSFLGGAIAAPVVVVVLFNETGVISMSENRVATLERGDCVKSSTPWAPGVWAREDAFVVTRRGEPLRGDEESCTLSRLRFGEERVGKEVVLEEEMEAGSVGIMKARLP